MGCINSKDMLKEFLFFKSKKARTPPNVMEAGGSASSPSRQYYSPRILKVMERLRRMDLSEVDCAIEASKDHWTKLELQNGSASDLLTNPLMGNLTEHSPEDSTSVLGLKRVREREGEATNVNLELYEENVAFIKSLQRDDPVGDFFRIDGVDGEWVLGRKIGEGGQATIYEANEFIESNGEKWTKPIPCVLKVFNVGFSLVDLRKQWPLALLHKLNPTNENYNHDSSLANCKSIWHGRLLRDGRFAFEMKRNWGDLRKLLDVRIQQNGNQCPPFMKPDGNCLELCMHKIMYQIADGMRDLHKEGTLHRDLKASNVLIKVRDGEKPLEDLVPESVLIEGDLWCYVADFECSIGVVGTGYWRAPEILKVVKNRTGSTMPDVFTRKSDVYSYAMTCYEIITGLTPFEDIEDGDTSCEDVIAGKRPTLPKHLKPWMKELICNCWHVDPIRRPTFEEILDALSQAKIEKLAFIGSHLKVTNI